MDRSQLPEIKALNFDSERTYIDNEIFSRWHKNIHSSSDDKNNTITIYEQIGTDYYGGGFTAKRMEGALRSIGNKNDVVVSINSPGGSFFEGAAIYNLLRQHKGKVNVQVVGLAASAASLIAMAGDSIQISEIGFFMIHNTWALVIGNRNDLRDAADTFETFDKAMADVYKARTGFDRNEIVKMMDKDTWLNASDAIEKGFADELMPGGVIKDEEDTKEKARAFAIRSIERAMAMQGMTRNERNKILNNAFGTRDAAEVAAREAGEKEDESLKELLATIKGG